MGVKRFSKTPEQKIKDKVGDAYFDKVLAYSEEDIAKEIVRANRSMYETKVDKKADEKLKAEKERYKHMRDIYDDVTRIENAHVAACIHVLKDRGRP